MPSKDALEAYFLAGKIGSAGRGDAHRRLSGVSVYMFHVGEPVKAGSFTCRVAPGQGHTALPHSALEALTPRNPTQSFPACNDIHFQVVSFFRGRLHWFSYLTTLARGSMSS